MRKNESDQNEVRRYLEDQIDRQNREDEDEEERRDAQRRLRDDDKERKGGNHG